MPTCRPIGVFLCLEVPSGANQLHKQIDGICGVDCGEGVVEEDGSALFINGSLQVIPKWTCGGFGIRRWVPNDMH